LHAVIHDYIIEKEGTKLILKFHITDNPYNVSYLLFIAQNSITKFMEVPDQIIFLLNNITNTHIKNNQKLVYILKKTIDSYIENFPVHNLDSDETEILDLDTYIDNYSITDTNKQVIVAYTKFNTMLETHPINVTHNKQEIQMINPKNDDINFKDVYVEDKKHINIF